MTTFTLTPGSVIHCTSEKHYSDILREAGASLVVVDCSASWCPPCQQISPRFEALAREFPSIVFVKVDVDEVPAVSKIVGVWALPTFAFYKEGKKLSSFMGANERKLRYGLENEGSLGICGSCSVM